jgi:hypothetical protein
VQVTFGTMPSLIEYIKAGRLRALERVPRKVSRRGFL